MQRTWVGNKIALVPLSGIPSIKYELKPFEDLGRKERKTHFMCISKTIKQKTKGPNRNTHWGPGSCTHTHTHTRLCLTIDSACTECRPKNRNHGKARGNLHCLGYETGEIGMYYILRLITCLGLNNDCGHTPRPLIIIYSRRGGV